MGVVLHYIGNGRLRGGSGLQQYMRQIMCTIGCYCHRPRNKRCTLLKILWLDSERFIALHIIPQLFTKIHEEFYCVIADQLVGKGCLSNADAAAAATTYWEAIA